MKLMTQQSWPSLNVNPYLKYVTFNVIRQLFLEVWAVDASLVEINSSSVCFCKNKETFYYNKLT